MVTVPAYAATIFLAANAKAVAKEEVKLVLSFCKAKIVKYRGRSPGYGQPKFSMKLIGYQRTAYANYFYNPGWVDQNVNLSLGIFIVARQRILLTKQFSELAPSVYVPILVLDCLVFDYSKFFILNL